MGKDTFGFASASRRNTAERLKEFRPEPAGREADYAELSRADAAGERVGFTSREPAEKPGPLRKKRRQERGVLVGVRAREAIARQFVEFCEDNRFTYGEGLEEVMKRAGLPEAK